MRPRASVRAWVRRRDLLLLAAGKDILLSTAGGPALVSALLCCHGVCATFHPMVHTPLQVEDAIAILVCNGLRGHRLLFVQLLKWLRIEVPWGILVGVLVQLFLGHCIWNLLAQLCLNR